MTPTLSSAEFPECDPAALVECSGGYGCPATEHIHGCFRDRPCPHDDPAQLVSDRRRRTVQADADRPVTDYEAFHRACFGNDDWEGT